MVTRPLDDQEKEDGSMIYDHISTTWWYFGENRPVILRLRDEKVDNQKIKKK